MTLSNRLYNLTESTKENARFYAFLLLPSITLSLFWLLNYLFLKIDIANAITHIPGISGTLAGFLFTFLGIFIALPSNKFIDTLRRNGYMKVIYNTLIIGIICLLTAMAMGVFGIAPKIVITIFIVGLSETYLSTYYLYKVSKLSLLSK